MKEVNQHFHDPSSITVESLSQMEYMNAVLKEALRMATPAPIVFDREALEDHSIGDLKIKKGTYINANFIGNNFDKRYHEEPEKFIPERWTDPNSLTLQSLGSQPMAFTPFSIGGRNCIGQHIAMMEAKIILGMFLKTYSYEMSDPNYKLQMAMTFLYEPATSLMYKLREAKEQEC